MFKRLFTAALVFGAAALAPPLSAQNVPCMPRHVLIGVLEEIHSEEMVASGLQGPDRMIEVWSHPETGAFTIFITNPHGISCVVAVGEAWENHATAPGVAS